jgi:hypothetical protein
VLCWTVYKPWLYRADCIALLEKESLSDFRINQRHSSWENCKFIERQKLRETKACDLLFKKLFMNWTEKYMYRFHVTSEPSLIAYYTGCLKFKSHRTSTQVFEIMLQYLLQIISFWNTDSRKGGGRGHCNYIMLSETARPAFCSSN